MTQGLKAIHLKAQAQNFYEIHDEKKLQTERGGHEIYLIRI